MKKLLTMIASAAMAFGLYAAGELATSFEANDAGVSGTTFTPGDGWTWTGDPLTLGTDARTLPYGEDTLARRDDVFEDGETNANYLELKTGTDELVFDAGDGNLFLDQLVKFTGFDEPQTNLVAGTKIAVWMSEFENDDETTETNLYVTCAKVGSEATETVYFQIDGTYALDTWYRLTVKNIGSIYGENPADAARAGFILYINGVQAKTLDERAKALVYYDTELNTTAKGYMNKGMLFPAIDVADADLNEVAYKGIGAIDDIIVDVAGPAFAQKITFTVGTADDCLVVDSIKETGTDTDVDPDEGVVSGTSVTVTYRAADGYKIMGDKVSVTKVITESTEIDPNEEGIEFAEVIATVTNAGDVAKFAESELYDMMNGLKDGDKVLFKKDATVLDGEENTLYDGLTEGTTINVVEEGDVTTWTIAIAGENGWVTDNVGAAANMTKVYTFEDDTGTVDIGQKVNVAGTLKAQVLNFTDAIQLAGEGKVLVKSNEFTDAEIIPVEDKELSISEEDEEGYYTYTSAEPAPTTGTVIFICEKNGFEMNQTNDTTEVGQPVPFPTITETDTTKYIGWFKEATFETPADTKVQEGENTYYAKVVDVVAKIDTAKYETIEAAYTAAEAGDTITMIASSSLAGQLKIEKNLTITATSSDITLTGPSGAYGLVIAADVTLAGGTIQAHETETRSIVNVGNPAGGDFGETAFVGNLIIDGATIKGTGNASAGNAIAAANGTVQIKSGAIMKIGNRGVKAEGTATITIDGGTITRNGEQPTLYTKESGKIIVNAGAIDGLIKVDSTTSSITIPGTSKATFDRDQTAFCAVGYLTKLNSEEPARYAVVQAVAVTGVALSESAVTIAPEATTNLTATLTPANADVKEAAWSTSAAGVATVADGVVTAVAEGKATITYTVVDYYNTTNSASCEVTVAVPAPVTPMIDPTEPTDPMSEKDAEAAAAEINAHPEKYIKVPTEFGEIGETALATYQTYFTAVVKGSGDNCTVALELNDTGKTALQNSVDTEIVKIKPADVAAGTAEDVTITTIPGFYYGVKAGNGIGTMAIKSSVPGTGTELKLDLPKFTGSGFYTIVASPTPMTVVE